VSGFVIQPLTFAGLAVVIRSRATDARGSFARLWCSEALADHGFDNGPVQINHSVTNRCGTIRGMHYQMPPHTETKLVTCIRGEIYDVAVDVRPDSPTYLRWHAELLSADNGRSLLIPEGFAHGFQTLTDDCEIIYCHSKPYVPAAEAALRFDDPAISIPWPIPVTIVSDRDRAHPLLTTSSASPPSAIGR
jgi:dTDP-4-dehydrorhamnose 3,5-epimerase